MSGEWRKSANSFDKMDLELARRVFTCIDNTTLNATDNEASVEAFCRRTLELTPQQLHVAAVCIYPPFIRVARRVLEGSGIHVATVAGAFPHGQLPLELKVDEVKRAVDDGADEVDIVINRGLLLAGRDSDACAEVAAMKKACQGRTLKVILETCELPSPILIEQAARVAIEGGADFIKTSTGKGAAGATLEGAKIMLNVIKDYVKICKIKVGFKAAGGIRKPEDALAYAQMAKKIMGEEYINNQLFRIGASSLTDGLFSILTFNLL